MKIPRCKSYQFETTIRKPGITLACETIKHKSVRFMKAVVMHVVLPREILLFD